MTRDLDKGKYAGYLAKAEKSLKVSKIALREGAYDAAVMNAVHSAINALDALTTYFLGKRSSGQHANPPSLTKSILTPQEQDDIEKQYKSLIRLKNASEYQPDMMKPKEAENSIKVAERILDKVRIKLPG
ncbi:HEPN domain-containing protein [Candidatus Nitrosotenuis chungbukensis]|uniref:HEPN domain-containing protein n=1 Tax=Candidatus Nitrosotenuis chungbukensis TaxID=1353246 RepID=UPI0005B2B5C6|nr:HEPN domain-containing protein [Candidatus Nitrosotenuis chungbukensis]WKT57918.1 HEPN domain-containing protein [Candidatus Nitrosotenuis chungbukensis]